MGAHVKGTAFLGTTRFLKESFGEEGFKKITARLGPEDRERAEAPMLPSAWYSLALLVSVMRAAKDEFGDTMPNLYREIGRASADYSLTTVYSLVFKVGSTQWIISRATAVFASYYERGR